MLVIDVPGRRGTSKPFTWMLGHAGNLRPSWCMRWRSRCPGNKSELRNESINNEQQSRRFLNMPFNYKSPGVYVEELSTGARPIEAAGTSVLAMVGLCNETIRVEELGKGIITKRTPN